MNKKRYLNYSLFLRNHRGTNLTEFRFTEALSCFVSVPQKISVFQNEKCEQSWLSHAYSTRQKKSYNMTFTCRYVSNSFHFQLLQLIHQLSKLVTTERVTHCSSRRREVKRILLGKSEEKRPFGKPRPGLPKLFKSACPWKF
jgi:hypothetical protein